MRTGPMCLLYYRIDSEHNKGVLNWHREVHKETDSRYFTMYKSNQYHGHLFVCK